MRPAMTALVVAIAGMMFPAMATQADKILNQYLFQNVYIIRIIMS